MGKSWENGDLYGKSPCLMGKLNYFDWAIYTIANCECLPEGIKVSPLKLDSAEHPTAILRNHHDKSYPIGSMYGIFTYIGIILNSLGVNVGKYSIHGSSGYILSLVVKQPHMPWLDLTCFLLGSTDGHPIHPPQDGNPKMMGI